MIYFLQSGDTPRVKIGRTGDRGKRLGVLQAGNPDILFPIREMPGGDTEERWLHHTFAEHWIHGDWFNLVHEMRTIEYPAEGCPWKPRRNRYKPGQRSYYRNPWLSALWAANPGLRARLADQVGISRAAVSMWQQAIPAQHIDVLAEMVGMTAEHIERCIAQDDHSR